MPDPTHTCADVYDIASVATHESGHFFGLDEDYSDTATTMYVFTNACDAHKRVLTSDDTQAITALYATPATMTASCSASPSPARSGEMFFAFGFAAAVFARRMRRDDARRSDGARARG
jgi:MYXO-CTERM domain-containing protein